MFFFYIVQVQLRENIQTSISFSSGGFLNSEFTAQPTKDDVDDHDDDDGIDGEDGSDDHASSTSSELFSCPYQGCALSFKRHSNLENHLAYGKCKLPKKSSPWKIKRNCSMFKNLQKVLVPSVSYTVQAPTLKAPHHCVKGGPCDRLKNQVVSMITSGVTWMKSFSSDKQQASSVIHHRWHVISAMPEPIPERDDSPSRSF